MSSKASTLTVEKNRNDVFPVLAPRLMDPFALSPTDHPTQPTTAAAWRWSLCSFRSSPGLPETPGAMGGAALLWMLG